MKRQILLMEFSAIVFTLSLLGLNSAWYAEPANNKEIKQDIKAPQQKVSHGGPPMLMKEYRQGDTIIGVIYINQNGLGVGDTIYPQVMRVSVSSGGTVQYQLDFFKLKSREERLREFAIQKNTILNLEESSLWRGLILSGTKDSTHLALLSGTVEVDAQFQPRFTGSIFFADQQTIANWVSGLRIDNVLQTLKQQVNISPGTPISIKDNLIQ
jgi:hypothetical protein